MTDTLKCMRQEDGAGHCLLLKTSGYNSLGLVKASLCIFHYQINLLQKQLKTLF